MKLTKPKRKRYVRDLPPMDFMKYWRVVRKWATINYDITMPELELLLFLRGEGLFTRADFSAFAVAMPWDAHRFQKLLKAGWIMQWNETNYKRQKRLYEVSRKGKILVLTIYRKLLGEEPIAQHRTNNVIYKVKVPHSHKSLRSIIERMNKENGY